MKKDPQKNLILKKIEFNIEKDQGPPTVDISYHKRKKKTLKLSSMETFEAFRIL